MFSPPQLIFQMLSQRGLATTWLLSCSLLLKKIENLELYTPQTRVFETIEVCNSNYSRSLPFILLTNKPVTAMDCHKTESCLRTVSSIESSRFQFACKKNSLNLLTDLERTHKFKGRISFPIYAIMFLVSLGTF